MSYEENIQKSVTNHTENFNMVITLITLKKNRI